jgi:hypothetical protein
MVRLLLLVLALLGAECAIAQIRVFSPRADAVSVTIYRDGLALVTETRNVELPADAATLVFEGVVDRLIPQSAIVSDLERPLAESNFTFDPLTAASLIKRSVGKTVTLIRTSAKTGKVTRVQATVVSANEGVVLQTTDGGEALLCSGLPEHLEFSEIPGELTPKPVLSVQLAAGTPGRRTVKLSYLTHGFSWRSNYVGRLNDRSDRMSLTGWVTLRNESNVSFKDAQVQLVAGRLNLIDEDEGGSRPDEPPSDTDHLPDAGTRELLALLDGARAWQQLEILHGCYALPVPAKPVPERYEALDRMFRRAVNEDDNALQESVVTATRVERETFGDYQLYRLPWPTDLNARQTKQAVFLSKPQVKVERFYSVRMGDIDDEPADRDASPSLMVRWENKKAAGLGEPLPQGRVRIFEPYDGGEVFAGEADLDDKPVGLPVELAIARALNLSAFFDPEESERDSSDDGDRITVTATHRFYNRKEVPVSIEVRQGASGYWTRPEVLRSNLRAGRKYGDLAWRIQLAPGAEQLLRYTIRARHVD